jgi:hypothetical protein
MWLVINIDSLRLDLTLLTKFSAKVLKELDTSLVWPRNFSDHVQLAVCIANVGVSDFFILPLWSIQTSLIWVFF